jgi:hypothetical protein
MPLLLSDDKQNCCKFEKSNDESESASSSAYVSLKRSMLANRRKDGINKVPDNESNNEFSFHQQ